MTPAAAAVDEVLGRYPRNEASLIMVLQDVQEILNWLPAEAIDAVAAGLGVPRSRVYGVASFYQSFSLEPRGKHQLDVCVGTACHVRGAERLVTQLSEELQVPAGGTTADGEFSLDTVHCVGACALGPVVLVDGEVHGDMTPRKLSRTVEEARGREPARRGSGGNGAGGGHRCACAEAAAGTATAATPAIPERIPDAAALAELREGLRADLAARKAVISVCAGSGCRAHGSTALLAAFEKELARAGLAAEVRLQANGCHGSCERGILVVLRPQGLLYQRVKPADVPEIIATTLQGGEVIERLLYEDPTTGERIPLEKDIPFYAHQTRLLMSQNALVDPCHLEDYIATGGYEAAAQVLGSWRPEQVIAEVREAGLRGRGGAGFHAVRKWTSCRKNRADVKYILCNADEGDPGAFMDRSLLEGNPHAVIEGMIIGAFAITGPEEGLAGAGGSGGNGSEAPRAAGYVYVRHEYDQTVRNLQVALAQARAAGLLGENILGTGFSYDVRVSRGGGAFVCGESTALMASIEGKIGEPRAKYIHTAESGLYGKPTVLNNVETWANVPLIVRDGAAKYAAVGTKKSTGTKIFSLVGNVNNTGLVEVPMGITLREIVYDIGGGIPNGKRFKAVQSGGPSGGCIPESRLDTPVDFDELTRIGSMMGSGGMIVMDEDTCLVDVARYFVEFLCHESCGKCVACRLGLANLKEILDRICAGEGREEDLPALEKLFTVLDDGSLCGLGKSAANPVRSTLEHFREEYEVHIRERRCPAGVCRALITYVIDESCTGCGACVKVCPHGAITGERKQLHVLDPEKCNRCGLCVASCKFDSIHAR